MIERMPVELGLALAQMAAAIWMFARGFERRERSAAVLVAAALAAGAAYFALSLLAGQAADVTAGMTPPLAAALVTALFWMVVPVAGALLVLGLFDVSAWTAVYAAAAGYTLQNLASGATDFIELILGGGSTEGVALLPTALIEVLVAVVTYVVAWRLVARPMAAGGLSAGRDRRMLAILGAVFLVVILFDTANKQLVRLGTPLELVLALKLVHGAACAFVLAMGNELLVNRHLREDALLSQTMLATERRQYELSRENIEAINVKCHDIRHQIRQLEGRAADPKVLEDITQQVDVYDSLIRTGNDALDVILSEKGLVCERERIDLRCIADGSALSFMAPTDIYALFGNALDNAIEASRKIERADERSIALTVREAAGMVSIHVENRFVGEVRTGADGLPQTSKDDALNHGFGTRSMRLIAQRYGGTMVTRAADGVFHLNVSLPLA